MSERDDNIRSNAEHDAGLSALYQRAGDPEPPAELDRALLMEAQRVARRRPQRWLLPLSTAAVVVVGVTLVLKMGLQPQLSPRPAGIPAQPSSPAPHQQKPVAPSQVVGQSPAKAEAAPAKEPAPPRAAAKRSSEAPAQFSAPASSDQMRSEKSAAPAVPPEAAGAAPMQDRASEPLGLESDPAPIPPERWLKQIGELLRAQKRSDAKTQLEAFRRRYPEYPIPKELKPLIGD